MKIRSSDLAGLRAALATRHQKEKVVGPALGRLGIDVVVADVDTDAFGTFTRTVPRVGSQLEAAFAKARAGLDVDPAADVGLASEGAYGVPVDPSVPSTGVELVVAVFRSGGAVVGRHVASGIRFEVERVHSVAEGLAFAERHPGLAFVVGGPADRPWLDSRAGVTGVALEVALERAVERWGPIVVQIDLRAMYHPARMAAVGAAADDLAHRLGTSCPGCGGCGWGAEGTEGGQPCEDCGLPTPCIRFDRWRCPWCARSTRIDRFGRAPSYHCLLCNP